MSTTVNCKSKLSKWSPAIHSAQWDAHVGGERKKKKQKKKKRGLQLPPRPKWKRCVLMTKKDIDIFGTGDFGIKRADLRSSGDT